MMTRCCSWYLPIFKGLNNGDASSFTLTMGFAATLYSKYRSEQWELCNLAV
jgi:hypothetical protein